ncbi:MAG: serine hydrolase [Chloroflexi bacterium]|nr:serine hydrolase [Chloroflexota bacterium]
MHKYTVILFMLMGLLGGCSRPSPNTQLTAANPPLTNPDPTGTAAIMATPTVHLPLTSTPIPTSTPPTPTLTPTPFYSGELSPACGQTLPILPTNTSPEVTTLSPNNEVLAVLQEMMPAAAVPAWHQILNHPQTVGLAAYRVGDEDNGVFLNADSQVPLASVVKLINLVAYVEATAAGQVDPASTVEVAALDAYYLPNYDVGGHSRSLGDLEGKGHIIADPPRIYLEDVAYMMMRHSSNAAADYLHLLLGQAVMEETAVSLNLASQTAPCTWVGQFMAMANHTSAAANDRAAIEGYLADPGSYGRTASLLTDAYISDPAFREAERNWHSATRRPSVATQRTFSHNLNAHGTPREYAALMARLSQNGLSNADSSFLARKYLEWPMIFPDNQEQFSNLGYKNGLLPGILTTIYYAYPKGETTPIVVALFFHDLPNRTYQQWRHTLPHDELARWLLYDPQAIPTLRTTFAR